MLRWATVPRPVPRERRPVRARWKMPDMLSATTFRALSCRRCRTGAWRPKHTPGPSMREPLVGSRGLGGIQHLGGETDGTAGGSLGTSLWATGGAGRGCPMIVRTGQGEGGVLAGGGDRGPPGVLRGCVPSCDYCSSDILIPRVSQARRYYDFHTYAPACSIFSFGSSREEYSSIPSAPVGRLHLMYSPPASCTILRLPLGEDIALALRFQVPQALDVMVSPARIEGTQQRQSTLTSVLYPM